MPVVHIEQRAFLLETNPSMQDERREPIARLAAEGRGGVEPATDLRRIDSKQPHPAERRHVDRIAVDDGTHQDRIGSFDL